MKTILSIDGGGVRALISAVVAQRLERYLAEISGNPDSRLCDFFDLFAGTSAGGILAAAYLCPEKDGRPRSASEITEIFAGMSKRVFRRSPLRQGLLRPKYSSSALKKTLYGLFGDVKFSELGGELMLTAFDMEHGRCFFFNTHSASLSERRDYRVADAALATSAAPVYFPPASITSVDDTHKLLADGGLYANNPAVCAYVEAHKLALLAALARKPRGDKRLFGNLPAQAVQHLHHGSHYYFVGLARLAPAYHLFRAANLVAGVAHGLGALGVAYGGGAEKLLHLDNVRGVVLLVRVAGAVPEYHVPPELLVYPRAQVPVGAKYYLLLGGNLPYKLKGVSARTDNVA